MGEASRSCCLEPLLIPRSWRIHAMDELLTIPPFIKPQPPPTSGYSGYSSRSTGSRLVRVIGHLRCICRGAAFKAAAPGGGAVTSCGGNQQPIQQLDDRQQRPGPRVIGVRATSASALSRRSGMPMGTPAGHWVRFHFRKWIWAPLERDEGFWELAIKEGALNR